MAVAVVAFIGTRAVDAEATGGWNTGSLDTDVYVQGSGAIGAKTSNATGRFYDLSVTGSPYDFSSGGADEGDHIFAWLNGLTPVDTTINGGFAIVVADDLATDSIGEWYVGADSTYSGGWLNFVIDPTRDFDNLVAAGSATWTTNGNPAQLTGVDGFGGRIKTITSIMGNFNNALVDSISVGTGYRVSRGDSTDADATFADVVSYEGTNTYGALRDVGGVVFMLGKILIGDSAVATDFTDSGFTVVWLDAPVASTFYEFAKSASTGTTNLSLTNGLLAAEGTTAKVYCNFTGYAACTLDTINIKNARLIDLDGNCTVTNGVWEDSGVIDLGGQPTVSGLTVLNADGVGIEVNAANEMDNVSDITIDGATTYGIEVDITGAGPFAIDLDGVTFANKGTNHINIVANSNADYTFNLSGSGTGLVAGDITNAGSGSVTINNAKTVKVTVFDGVDLSAISTARVLMLADTGGDLPAEEAVTQITRVTTTATVSHTAHGMNSGEQVLIRGANQDEYNGVKTISNVTANAYDYTVSGSPTTPATGTITATGVVLAGTTNGSGILQRTDFSYTSDQPIGGRVRKHDGVDLYVDGQLTGTITDTGFTGSVVLGRDE